MSRKPIQFEESPSGKDNIGVVRSPDETVLKLHHGEFFAAAALERDAETLKDKTSQRTSLETEIEKDILIGPLHVASSPSDGQFILKASGLIDRGYLRRGDVKVYELQGERKIPRDTVTLEKINPTELTVRTKRGVSLPSAPIYLQLSEYGYAQHTCKALKALGEAESYWETRPHKLPPIDIAPTTEDIEIFEITKTLSDPSFQEAFCLISRAHKLSGIKGPPGTGKTYLLAWAICQILRQNKKARILVTSKNHKPINNLLASIVQYSRALYREGLLGYQARIGKKTKDTEEKREITKHGIESVDFSKKDKVGDKVNHWEDFQVIGATLDSLVHEKHFINSAPADFIFYEEAGQTPAYQIAATHHLGKNLVLAGDEDQLPPIYQACHSAEGNAAESGLAYLRLTCPERVTTLLTTHRLCQELCKVIQPNYYPDVNLQPGKNRQARLIHKTEGSPHKGLHFIPSFNSRSRKRNIEEVGIAVTAILDLQENYLYQENPESKPRELTEEDFCVLTPYNEQATLIEHHLKEKTGKTFTCGTIHRLQGQGRPVVISSLCSSNIHFMKEVAEWLFEEAMWNVTISRGMALCVLIANKEAITKCEPKTLEGSTKKQKLEKILKL